MGRKEVIRDLRQSKEKHAQIVRYPRTGEMICAPKPDGVNSTVRASDYKPQDKHKHKEVKR